MNIVNEIDIEEVPLLDLQAQYLQIRDEINQAVNDVLESQYFIMGPHVKEFENQMSVYCEAAHAIGCASGSDALLLSLMALDIGPGDAVITTPFTFFATAGAIARLGATPVFLDIDPATYNIDPKQIERFLDGSHPLNKKLDIYREDVKVIIPVHLYGQMADMDPIIELAKAYDIKIIEDAAQAIGSEYRGRKAGSMGDFGCFSFFPSKNLGGYGDGGLVTTNSDEMAEKIRVLRLHGSKPKYHHKTVGINSRLDAIQAAVLKVKLQYLDQWSKQRREKALTYNKLFQETGLAGETSNGHSEEMIITPKEIEGKPENLGKHIYHQYIIQTSQRDKIIEAFKAKNIGYSIYYPVPLHEQECFQYLGYEPEDCRVSHNCAKRTLALPIYPELSRDQQKYVVDTIAQSLLTTTENISLSYV
jgi:dTDP-4-amino-4,6-dideoxygalactose transaminase